MQIDIYANGFTTTGALRAHVTRRLQYAFGCCAKRISRTIVHLSDINGPRGGVDKRCQIQVRLAALSDVVIEDTEADMYVAIDLAAERASRIVVRHLARQRRPVRRAPLQETASSVLTELKVGGNGPQP